MRQKLKIPTLSIQRTDGQGRGTRFYLTHLFSLFFLALICARAQRGGNADPAHAIGTKQTVDGIPNFGRVNANFYRGGVPNAAGLDALKKMGVEIVVDMRGGASESERDMTTKLGMQYVSIPSHCPFPSDRPWARFLELMEENRGKKVFVPCRLGDDRTGLAVASYRMAEQGWSAEEALKEMRAFGFSPWHQAICPGLESYEKNFPERLKKDAAFQKLPSRQQHESQERELDERN